MADDRKKTFTAEKFNWLDCVMNDRDLKPAAFKIAYAIMQHVNSETLFAWLGARDIGCFRTRNEGHHCRDVVHGSVAFERGIRRLGFSPIARGWVEFCIDRARLDVVDGDTAVSHLPGQSLRKHPDGPLGRR